VAVCWSSRSGSAKLRAIFSLRCSVRPETHPRREIEQTINWLWLSASATSPTSAEQVGATHPHVHRRSGATHCQKKRFDPSPQPRQRFRSGR
jgi:hypothetical protein